MLTTASSACVCLDVPIMVSAFWTQASQRTGTGKPMSTGHDPRIGSHHITSQPVWGGVHVYLAIYFCSLEVLLDGFLFCCSLIILQQCPAQTFFSISWPENLFQTRQSLRSFPTCYSIIPLYWVGLESFSLRLSQGLLSGTQLTSVGRRMWQGTQAECHTSSSLHRMTICSSCLITPRYSLCCLWLIRC